MGIPLKHITLCVLLYALSIGVVAARSTDEESGAGSRIGSDRGSYVSAYGYGTHAREADDSLGARRRVSFDPEITEAVSRFGYAFKQRTSAHYQLMYRDRNLPMQVVARTSELLEQAYQRFYADFKNAGFELDHPTAPMPWVVFDRQQQYRDFARMADGMDSHSLESYYSARSNHVVLMQINVRNDNYGEFYSSGGSHQNGVSGMDYQPNNGVMTNYGGMLEVRRATHEAAHQLAFNSGIQKRGVMYPLWLSEGLATSFESDDVDTIRVGGVNVARARQLLRAHEGDRLMPLDGFVNLVDIPPGGPGIANDLYAEAWGLFSFLFKTRHAELKRYLHHLSVLDAGSRDSQTMYNEFTAAFGPVHKMEKAWSNYLKSLQIHAAR